MPKELLVRLNLDYLYPPFLEEALKMLGALKDAGKEYRATFGWRSYGQQHTLRQKYLSGTGGKAAPAGYSQHQFGLALDVVSDRDLMMPGLQPDWGDKAYIPLGKEISKYPALHWGSLYNDSPHVGWHKFVNGVELGPLRAAWAASSGSDLDRLKEVWKVVDAAR